MNSRHHIIARSEGGSDHIDNIVRLEKKMHDRVHLLFGNIMPHEQINIIERIASTALRPEFRSTLLGVMHDFEGAYYKGHTFKNGIYRKS